jgi:predicted Zn-dependent protease
MVGTRGVRGAPIAGWDFKFFVLDDDDLNAFTIGGGYVYLHRGLLVYLNSEAELATRSAGARGDVRRRRGRLDAGLRARAGIRGRPRPRVCPWMKFKKEQLLLLNAMYPKGEPKPGELFKIVQ